MARTLHAATEINLRDMIMKSSRKLSVASIVVATMMLATRTDAAEISVTRAPNGDPMRGVTIEGEIAPGDFKEFVALVLASEGANTVWLASPGGDIAEALQIGRFIRQQSLEVWAPMFQERPLIRLKDPKNNVCASACFFLYAAGVERFGRVVGIHRPYLSQNDYKATDLDRAAAAHAVLRDRIAGYLEEMDVPSKYLPRMMSAASDEIVWLSREDIETDFDGLIDEYEEWFRANCPFVTAVQKSEVRRQSEKLHRGGQLTPDEEAFQEEYDRTDQAQVECTSKRLTEVQERKRRELVARLLGRR